MEVMRMASADFGVLDRLETLRFHQHDAIGVLHLAFDHAPKDCTDYRRELNLDTAISRVTYKHAGAEFTREAFSSAPDQLIVVRLTCNLPGRLTLLLTNPAQRFPLACVPEPDRLGLRVPALEG